MPLSPWKFRSEYIIGAMKNKKNQEAMYGTDAAAEANAEIQDKDDEVAN